MEPFDNSRILVIDDEATMHEDFRSVLTPPAATDADENLSRLEASMFGDAPQPPKRRFAASFAFQGGEGADLARAALQEQLPFAVAFVDMRMPPGWDGLRTIRELWRLDPRLQVVICTAYSDYSWEDALTELEPQDRLLVVKKPFDPIEVWLAATTLSAKWALARQAEAMTEILQRTKPSPRSVGL